MRALATVILVALAACDYDEDCDPTLRHLTVDSSDASWFEYIDSEDYQVGAWRTAVGGTQRYAAGGETDCGDPLPITPLSVTNSAPNIATITTLGATVDVHGLAPGVANLALAGGGLTAHWAMNVAAIDHVQLAGQELGEPGAFYAGTSIAKIVLLDSDTQPVVDRNLTVTGAIPQGVRWDELAMSTATPAVYSLVIHAGGADWPITARVVDHIDDVTARDATITSPQYLTAHACFFAHVDGVVVAGVPWQIDFDKFSGQLDSPNCVAVWVGADQKMVQTITAHALGFTATTTVTFTK